MSQATMSQSAAERQEGILSVLRDLLTASGIRSRVVRHIKLNMSGAIVREYLGAELEVYGPERKTAVVKIVKVRASNRSYFAAFPKSGTVVPLSDVKSPNETLTWIKGWASGERTPQ